MSRKRILEIEFIHQLQNEEYEDATGYSQVNVFCSINAESLVLLFAEFLFAEPMLSPLE